MCEARMGAGDNGTSGLKGRVSLIIVQVKRRGEPRGAHQTCTACLPLPSPPIQTPPLHPHLASVSVITGMGSQARSSNGVWGSSSRRSAWGVGQRGIQVVGGAPGGVLTTWLWTPVGLWIARRAGNKKPR